jgi:protocatechuate 3,4-dioxygenase beta subunit
MRQDRDDPAPKAADPIQQPTRRDGHDRGSRRAFIKSGSLRATTVALTAAGVVASGQAASADQPAAGRPRVAGAKRGRAPLAVTPACDGHETPEATEGPLFKPESPERTDFVTPAIQGVACELSGVVYDTACKPLTGVLIEFWQCNHNGDYDTTGFTLRGHQYTKTSGAFRLKTIVPRDYWGRWGQRAPHIHTKVQAPGGPVLITQLYFPGDTDAYGRDFAALNARDQLFNQACIIDLGGKTADGYRGTFDFVIKTTA